MLSNFPNGVSSFGVPVMGAGQIPATTGNYWFVNSVTGSNGNMGQSPTAPFATIAQARTAATANNGDVVIVMPGHVESVAAAAGIAFSKAGIYYIGLGNGAQRPTITFTTATTATATITAASNTIDNFVFLQTFDAIVSPFVVSASDTTFKNNYFQTATATAQVTQMILTTAAANNLTLQSNRFIGTSDAGNTSAVTIVGTDNFQAFNNDFIGAYTTSVGAIQGITTLSTNVNIRQNTFVNKTASATKAAVFLTGSTGIITENKVGIGSGAAPFTLDAGWWNGNWSSAAVATNGTLV